MIVRLTMFLAGVPVSAMLGACTPVGTRPTDMSVTSHQAAAKAEEAQAVEHAQQHDTNATAAEENCARQGTERQACWSDSVDATAEHQEMALEHREMAAKHRAAAAALVSAEASACDGLSEMDRDMSPFAHKADIRGATDLTEKIHDEEEYTSDIAAGSPGERQRLVGASVVFKAVPGMTAEWLQRVVDCHLARNAALGHNVPEMAYCPLVPKGAMARVRSVGDGFAVDIQGDNETSIREIVRRARMLTSSDR